MNACCLVATIMIFSDAVWRKPALQLERELRAPCVCVEHVDIPERFFNQTVVWGAPGYFDRIRHRIPAVRRRLTEQLGGSDAIGGWLALFDADIVALRNVSARFTRTFEQAPQVLVLAQQEWPCKGAHFCINGGMWAVRRSRASLAVLERAEWLITRLRIPDQDALQIATAELPAGALVLLDRERYPNGFIALSHKRRSALNAHAVHVNWLSTLECKLAWLDFFRSVRFHSLWSTGEHRAEESADKRCGVSL